MKDEFDVLCTATMMVLHFLGLVSGFFIATLAIWWLVEAVW